MTSEVAERSLLRLYTLAGDTLHGHPLADAVLEAARQAGLAGATVLRGTAGFGRHGFDTVLDVMEYRPERQPVVVEIVDRQERLESFIADLWARGLPARLMTLERAELVTGQAVPPPERP
ncbi:DUF190 domain-containing protein [Deinococcus aluminii]|uniref:DUF190 domain-containing protein n=1 Tax=Deinococcus aluminii TaxID=1656885 RepID=A0ABP9XFC6_9DEIO